MAEYGRSSGWRSRVAFAPDGGFAYRPNQVLVHDGVAEQAAEVFDRWAGELSKGKDERPAFVRDENPIAGEFVRFTGPFRVSDAVDRLHSAGVLAQPNHVVFATGCCPPHPSDPHAEAFYNSAAARETGGVGAKPFYANPFYANPFYANPFYTNQGGCCGCRCGCAGANPFYANPFYANPFYANPFYANADPSPFTVPALRLTGDRRSSARPAERPDEISGTSASGVRIAILDTGWATADHAPGGLGTISITAQGHDEPDSDGDAFLDPAAGHGTFIAGIIEQLAPGAELEAIRVLSGHGDGDEAEIAAQLWALAQRPDTPDSTEPLRPHFVNLSFGGYSPHGMGALAHAVTALTEAGSVVVASAGNDATCIPMYPAVLSDVVGVAALDDDGEPAVFTNYGPWVRACTVGVDVRSLFFDRFNGAEPADGDDDPDRFEGWATWSGTSFAAPRVVAALAQRVTDSFTPRQAVGALVEHQSLTRKPMLGTVVNPV